MKYFKVENNEIKECKKDDVGAVEREVHSHKELAIVNGEVLMTGAPKRQEIHKK